MASASKWVKAHEGLWLEECESTNDVARQCAETGAPSGYWVSADRQTRGRGRSGHEWSSESGNLHLSLVVRPKDFDAEPARLMTWIPLAAAEGVARAVESINGRLRVFLKWPNDLYVQQGDGWAKLGGLLCEGNSDFIVIGIGVNFKSAPSVPGMPTACVGGEAKQHIDFMAHSVLMALERLYLEGTSPVERAFLLSGVLNPGVEIQWADQKGVVMGLGEAGELIVQSSKDGSVVPLYAEDVSISKESLKIDLASGVMRPARS